MKSLGLFISWVILNIGFVSGLIYLSKQGACRSEAGFVLQYTPLFVMNVIVYLINKIVLKNEEKFMLFLLPAYLLPFLPLFFYEISK
jgi:hypothetical protein